MTDSSIARPQNAIATWVMAARPKTLTAALVPVFVATFVVVGRGHMPDWSVTIFAVLSALMIQIGTNFFNDALDFEKGADTKDRVGPRRVTQAGLLTPKQVKVLGYLCFLIAACLGVPLIFKGGLPILIVGLVSLVCGYAYTGGPFPLAYRGLGEVFVLLFFGLVAVGGTYYLHVKSFGPDAVVAGLQVGFLAMVLISINNYRDAAQDVLVNKRTIAVRFGPQVTRALIASFVIIPFLLGLYWWQKGEVLAAALPLPLLFLSFILIRGVYKSTGSNLNRLLALAALQHLLFGFLLSVGLVWN